MYGQPEGEDPKPAPQSTWPDDWRTAVAGDDEKVVKQLERYADPAAALKAGLAAQQKIRSGEFRNNDPLPEDATDEQKAEYYEARGMPVAPDDYQLPLLEGMDESQLTDQDKEIQGRFRETFHKAGLSQDQVNVVTSVANEITAQEMQRTAERDATNQETAEDALRATWGPEYRANVALNAQYLHDEFGENWADMMSARKPDGTRLCDDPEFGKWINSKAREAGGTTLETGVAVTQRVGEARIAEIEEVMATDWGKYNSNKLMKEEYGRLLAAREGGRG